MTTPIVPQAGAGVLYTQQGTGTTPGYAALDDRRQASGPLQEGVYGTSTAVTAGGVSNVTAADFMVTQRAAGANLSVDINMPAGGFGYVQGDTISGQGLYCVPVHASNINEAIATADLTNPRIDQVILEVQDNVLDASGGNQSRTRVLTGTPTSGATLANRSGATALPGNALLLADVLVPINATTVPNSNIRDRRKWARGAYAELMHTGPYTTSSTSYAAIDSTNLSARLECGGSPVKVRLRLPSLSNGTSLGGMAFEPWMDGAVVGGGVFTFQNASGVSGQSGAPCLEWTVTPAAGSHVFTWAWEAVNTGTATITGSSGQVEVEFEEVLRSNAANSNGVTTG